MKKCLDFPQNNIKNNKELYEKCACRQQQVHTFTGKIVGKHESARR